MYKVGLTGNIGSGKTTTADLFQELGIEVFDADIIARELTEPGTEFYQKIAEHFDNILLEDKTIDRRKLRDIVFQDNHHKTWLENLLHPTIMETLKEKSDNASSVYSILVIPLLFEKNLTSHIDTTLLVVSYNDLQISRAANRDNSEQSIIESIKNSQISSFDAEELADNIIYNNGSINDLEDKVKDLHQKYIIDAKA